MSQISLTVLATLFPLVGADALRAVMPAPTMPGLMATVGMSPRPTHPPEVPRGIPKEVARRRTTVDYPAPGYYCGLVDNDINSILTCVNDQAYCMYYFTAVGCCISSDLYSCTNMPTSCIDWGQSCDSSCQNNPRILSCSRTTEPYCGTYFFSSGTRLLACFSTQYASYSVVMLKDYFSSELGPDFTTLLDGLTSSSSSSSRYIYTTANTNEDISHSTSSVSTSAYDSGSASGSSTSAAGASSTSTSGSDNHPSSSKNTGGGISSGTIAGIVVGVVPVAAAFAAFLIWVFFVKRKKNDDRNEPAASQQPPQIPPMIQQHQPYGQGPLPPGAGYYSHDGNKPYGQQNEPQRYSTTGDITPGIPEISGTPVQQQSQPLLSDSEAEYYNRNGSSEIYQRQQQPSSEINSISPFNRATSPAISNPGTTVSSVSSPRGGGGGGGYQISSHNHSSAGPIYELDTGR